MLEEDPECTQDCLGVWGGPAIEDECGVCDGNGFPCFSDGDTNLDGEIDVLDVVLLVNFILGDIELENSQIEVSDINSDLSIDILDVILLINLILEY